MKGCSLYAKIGFIDFHVYLKVYEYKDKIAYLSSSYVNWNRRKALSYYELNNPDIKKIFLETIHCALLVECIYEWRKIEIHFSMTHCGDLSIMYRSRGLKLFSIIYITRQSAVCLWYRKLILPYQICYFQLQSFY